MFGLKVIRRRLFESNLIIPQPKWVKRNGTVPGGQYVTPLGYGVMDPVGLQPGERQANRLDDEERTYSGGPSSLYSVYRKTSDMEFVKYPEEAKTVFLPVAPLSYCSTEVYNKNI